MFMYQKYDYSVLSTIATSNITGQSSNYPISAFQSWNNSYIQTRDQLTSLVTPIESQKLQILHSIKHMQPHNGSNTPPSPHYIGTCNTNQLKRNLAWKRIWCVKATKIFLLTEHAYKSRCISFREWFPHPISC